MKIKFLGTQKGQEILAKDYSTILNYLNSNDVEDLEISILNFYDLNDKEKLIKKASKSTQYPNYKKDKPNALILETSFPNHLINYEIGRALNADIPIWILCRTKSYSPVIITTKKKLITIKHFNSRNLPKKLNEILESIMISTHKNSFSVMLTEQNMNYINKLETKKGKSKNLILNELIEKHRLKTKNREPA